MVLNRGVVAALIRRVNFKQVCKTRSLTPTKLAEQLGSRPSYWRDLLETDKSFGEKAARRVEEGLQLPPGWLDEPHEPGQIPIAPPPLNVLPLREGETDLITAFRLLKDADRDEMLRGVFALVQREHELTGKMMERLNIATRASDARVHEILGRIAKPDTGRRVSDIPVDVDRRKAKP